MWHCIEQSEGLPGAEKYQIEEQVKTLNKNFNSNYCGCFYLGGNPTSVQSHNVVASCWLECGVCYATLALQRIAFCCGTGDYSEPLPPSFDSLFFFLLYVPGHPGVHQNMCNYSSEKNVWLSLAKVIRIIK